MERTTIRFSKCVVILILSLGFVGYLSDVQAQSQKGMMKTPEFQKIVPSKYNFNDTVELLKGAIEAQNMMVIKEIDAQKMLRMVGVQSKGMKQILFFHPRFMKQIILTNKQAAIEPPLKFGVMEAPNGKVIVKFIRPTYLFGRYKALKKLGEELEAIMEKMLESVKK